MGCVSSTGGDAHGDKTQTPYAALREGEMKLLLGNPGGGFANAWYCTGGCSLVQKLMLILIEQRSVAHVLFR